MKRTKMDEIVENMANYICDHICQKPKEITDREKLEDYCAEECEMGQHFCNILTSTIRSTILKKANCVK